MSNGDIAALVCTILFSAFFSGSEMAYVLSNHLKLEIRAKKKTLAAKYALYFVRKPEHFFSTILIGNTIANILYGSLATLVLTHAFGWSEWSILLVSTIVILIFGELIPKYLARDTADTTVLLSAIPLRILAFILKPIIYLTSFVSTKLTDAVGSREEELIQIFDKDELKRLVEESHAAGTVNPQQSELIRKALEFQEQRVHEAMRPRTEIVAVDISDSVETALNKFIESGYSKMPVYEGDVDNIKGVVFAYDFFRKPDSLKSVVREILFVPETKMSYDLLNEFQAKRISMAVVIDEFGGTAGIVTIEDIIEEFFGEIKDEYDTEENICRKLSENLFLVGGIVEIDFINEQFGLGIPEGEYETVSGWVLETIGKIPEQNEEVFIDHFKLFIVRASAIRIELVRITVTETL